MQTKAEWFRKRVAEREEKNQRDIARGVPRDALLDPQLTAISEYYMLGLHRTEETDGMATRHPGDQT